MIISKKILSSIVSLVPIFLSSLNIYGDMSLSDLQTKCMEYRDNNQMKPFNIKVDCRGQYTYWETEKGLMRLMNQLNMVTQTSTKSGQYQTETSTFTREIPSNRLDCAVHIKKEVTSPEGMGISLKIGSCEELSNENIEALCKEKVHEYCEDNSVVINTSAGSSSSSLSSSSLSSSSSSSSANTGMCVIRDIEVFNTCRNYQ